MIIISLTVAAFIVLFFWAPFFTARKEYEKEYEEEKLQRNEKLEESIEELSKSIVFVMRAIEAEKTFDADMLATIEASIRDIQRIINEGEVDDYLFQDLDTQYKKFLIIKDGFIKSGKFSNDFKRYVYVLDNKFQKILQ